jgi:hypothetical protein
LILLHLQHVQLVRFAILLFIVVLGVLPARGQVFRLNVEDVPLEHALALVHEQGGVDIVFAHRLIENRRTTCQYAGNHPGEALDCVLHNTGIHWQTVRHRQYVLVNGSKQETAPEAPPLRGVVSGFITDAETGENLPGGHVYIPALKLGAVTNNAGYFAIANLPVGEYQLRITYVGYEAAFVTAEVNAAPQVVPLQPIVFEAEGVIVEAERDVLPEESTLPGTISLPLQALEALPSFPGDQDLFQSLQWLPGVQKLGELNGTLVIRGGEADQNLYLLDGAPVYHPWHAFSLISTFQTETFKDVNLYRGVFPVEHGGRLSAVLDTQLKDGSRTSTHFTAGLSVLSGRFMVESPLGKNTSFMLSGRRSYLDKIIGRKHAVSGPDGQRDTLRTGYYFYDLSGKVTFQPNINHRLSLTHYRGEDLLDLRLPFDLSLDFSSWLKPADLFFEIDQRWGNQLSSLRYQYLYSPRLFTTITAYRSSYSAVEGAFIHPTSTATLESDYNVQLRDYGLKIDIDYYYGVSHQLRTGVHVVRHGFASALDASVRRTVSATEEQHERNASRAWEVAAYVQDVWQPAAKWQVLPGIRGSLFGKGMHFRLSPAVSVRYAVNPTVTLRASANSQVQYMHRLRDRYSFMYDLVSSRWIPTGRSVRPSSSMHLAAGMENHPWPWLTLVSDVYWRSSDNILLPEDFYQTKDGLEGPGIDVGTLLGQYTPASGRAYGIEVTAQAEQGSWRLWLSYTGGRSLNRTPEMDTLGYRPSRFDVPRSLHGVGSYNLRRWNFMLAGELRSGYPHSVPVARYEVGDPLDEEPVDYLYRPYLNNGRLPPYFRLDAAVSYNFRLFGTKWRSQFYVYNILNRRSVVGRQYEPSEDAVRRIDRRSLPLLPLLEFEVTL